MVFACASAQVAVNGSTTREMIDALNICLLLLLAKFAKSSLPRKEGMLIVEMSANCSCGHWGPQCGARAFAMCRPSEKFKYDQK